MMKKIFWIILILLLISSPVFAERVRIVGGGIGTEVQTLSDILGLGADANDIDITSLGKLEGIDPLVYIDLGTDGYADIEADVAVRVTAPLWVEDGIDAIGAVDMDYGSADVTDHTFITDGTGDGEIVLPNDSIGPAEIDSTTGAYDFSGVTSVTLSSITKNDDKHLLVTIIDPLTTQTEDNEICLWPETDAALTITKITVTLDAAGNEVAGDLKYADTFIGLANPVVINVFDTTSGVLEDSSITSGSVAAGKCIYLAFDSAPNTAIHQMSIDIKFDYD